MRVLVAPMPICVFHVQAASRTETRALHDLYFTEVLVAVMLAMDTFRGMVREMVRLRRLLLVRFSYS